MKNIYLLKHRYAVHVYSWLFFFNAIYLPVFYFNSALFAFKIASGVVFPLVLPVYLNFYLLDNYLKKRKYAIYYVFVIVLMVLSGGFAQIVANIIITPDGDSFFGAFLNPAFIIIFTSGMRYYFRGLKLQIKLHEIEAKQIKAENDLLKFQINPHFLFNTLNNLFAMARQQNDPATASGIAKLSHIMRYIIYDANADKIDLNMEVEQISSFIDLQRLRFTESDDVHIAFNVKGDIHSTQITPMLLIPFVENAFKHGISLNNPSSIIIDLEITDDVLTFFVKNNINKLKHKWKELTSGIGLKNVKRRLELLYPDAFELEINNNGDYFEVKLKLELV